MRAAAVAVLLIASAFLGRRGLAGRLPPAPEQRIRYRPIEVAEDGYTSSQPCRACHPSEYASWYESYHRTMTQLATSKSVRASFDGVTVSAVQGAPMRLERRGAQYWAEFDDPDWVGEKQPPRIQRQLVMVTGSHHQQVYWYRTDRTRLIGQLPAIYLIEERRWIPRRAAFMHPPTERAVSETGRWNGVCINCHATHGKSKFEAPLDSTALDAEMADTNVAEFGIACEACHGPGDRHVTLNHNPVRRYRLHVTGQVDDTIVRPELLDPKLSSQVCGQCHGIWKYYDPADVEQANWAGLAYRPGADLLTSRFVVQPTATGSSDMLNRVVARDPTLLEDSFWPDGMIRVSGREYNGLIDSPCFKAATDPKRTMSCFSCHAMHTNPNRPQLAGEWANRYQLASGMDGDRACLQCHERIGSNIPGHTNHQAGSSGSSCYNCHMPYTTYGLLKALRSHQVSSPTVAATVSAGRPNACNLCHLDKTLLWTSEYLDQWYETPKVSLTEDDRTIAASLLWLLRGDAGQRALAAWSMGWKPAQEASGTSWMPPFLSVWLDDPYDAVRFIAYRSLASIPGYGDLPANHMASRDRRLADVQAVLDIWQRTRRPDGRQVDPALLFDSGGAIRGDVVRRLAGQRDDRRVNFRE